jgi:asparagine synthase (glutamine-hydrolysing)
MCGIAGGFRFGADRGTIDAVVARLNDWQRRRGPDGEGLWTSPGGAIALGHRRLAIIDTSPAGAQPMADRAGRWVITFNGEIYNYRELRAELEELGCRFRTNSDTEVLIEVVARWGETGLLKLRGMYAFALWDAEERELWLVRDPYGIKPLYFTERDGTLWFASQARALASCVPASFPVEPAARVGFYLWGFVPEPWTWWDGVNLLPAGHLLRVREGKPLAAPSQFCAVQNAFANRPIPPFSLTRLRELMLESVRYHLVSDVPVGLFLSSGVDSTVLASLAAELGVRLRTVTLAFDEFLGTPEDEAPLAEEVARALGTEHQTIRIGYDKFEELLGEFLDSMDQPTIDGLNTFLVSRAAAGTGLKVALSGLGGDELSGGYPSFSQIPRLRKWLGGAPWPRSLGAVAATVARIFMPEGVSPKVAGLFRYTGSVAHAYFLRRALYLDDELGAMIDRKTLREGLEKLATLKALAKVVEPLAEAEVSDYAQVAMLEAGWYMRNQLLRDTDWASMAHGLEVRVPYIDPALLRRVGPAIASSSPPGKRDFAACAERLPAGVVGRAKTGFATPVNRWIQETTGIRARGLRGWASYVEEQFRAPGMATSPAAPRAEPLQAVR